MATSDLLQIAKINLMKSNSHSRLLVANEVIMTPKHNDTCEILVEDMCPLSALAKYKKSDTKVGLVSIFASEDTKQLLLSTNLLKHLIFEWRYFLYRKLDMSYYCTEPLIIVTDLDVRNTQNTSCNTLLCTNTTNDYNSLYQKVGLLLRQFETEECDTLILT